MRGGHLFLTLMVKFLSIVLGIHGSIFISEPLNVTVIEGESTTMNCSSTMNEFFAIWIINGRQHLWSEFEKFDTYTFDPFNNSLTINNSPRSLDGASFQCVINRQESEIGYLTVLYHAAVSTTTSSELSTKNTTLFTHSSTVPMSTVTVTQVIEPTSDTVLDHFTVYILSSIGVIIFIFATVCCCLLVLYLVQRCRSKQNMTVNSSAVVDSFDMVMNEVYGRVDIKMTRNSAYSHQSHFSRTP